MAAELDTRVEDFLVAGLAVMRCWAPADGAFTVPAWFRGALRALVAADVLDRNTRDGWLARARDALRGTSVSARPSPALLRRAEDLVARAKRDGQGGLLQALRELGVAVPDGRILAPDALTPPPAFDSPRAERWFSAERLDRILVPPAAAGGAQLVAVELYEGGLVLHWCTAAGVRTNDDRQPFTRVMDDLGTRYVLAAGSGGNCGPDSAATSTECFAPRVSDQVSMLRITRGSLELELSMTDAR